MTYSEKVEVELVWDGALGCVDLLGCAVYTEDGPCGWAEEDFTTEQLAAARRVYDANRELAEGETRHKRMPHVIEDKTAQLERECKRAHKALIARVKP